MAFEFPAILREGFFRYFYLHLLMLLGFKTELKVNKFQKTLFLKHAGIARHAWNWGLALTKQILEHNKQSGKEDNIKFPPA